jgi:hypothetical protein
MSRTDGATGHRPAVCVWRGKGLEGAFSKQERSHGMGRVSLNGNGTGIEQVWSGEDAKNGKGV